MNRTLLPKLCLVEDDEIMGESLSDRFELEGYACDWHKTAKSALPNIEKNDYAVVISDIRLPDLSGAEMFARLRGKMAALPPFIFITGFGSIDHAVQLLKLGAADYITKPFDLEQLLEKVRFLCQERVGQHPRLAESTLGISAAMRKVEEMLPRLALHATTVLITGESGVGKEKVAQEFHSHIPDAANKPFVAVNCGALTESLMEAELFGYEKGAFTGALRTKKGLFEQANGGTLFLDEIGEMPPSMQVKLLRAIQERQIVRVGGEARIPVDLHLVCATNRDLRKMVEDGTFREDLFYRVNVIHLKIPPLRERKEDILWFAELFLRQFAQQHHSQKKTLHPAAEHALLSYAWPGNLRELKHCIERACILSNESLLEPEAFFEENAGYEGSSNAPAAKNLNQYLQECERDYILLALDAQQWHFTRTAEFLGISRKNLWEKMKKLEIQSRHSALDTPQ
jgi:two-component system response regulator AtoC